MLGREANTDGTGSDTIKHLLKMMEDAATDRSRTEEEQTAAALENVARLDLSPWKHSAADVYSIAEARRRMQALGIPAYGTGDVLTSPSPAHELREHTAHKEDKREEEEEGAEEEEVEEEERSHKRRDVETEMARLKARLASDGRDDTTPPPRQRLPPRKTDIATKRAVRRNRVVGLGAALLVVFLVVLLLLVLRRTKVRLFRRRVPRPQQEHQRRKSATPADDSEKSHNEQGKTTLTPRK